MHLKARLMAAIIIMIFAGIIYYTWHQVHTVGEYSMKFAVFGPVGVVGGFFLLLFPTKFGKPETTMDKVIVMLVFGLGIILGLVNWYLIDPGYFGG
jgi:hypothetical protein